MPRNITVTLADGTQHVYANAPDTITPDQVATRAQTDFGQAATKIDGGRGAPPAPKTQSPADTAAFNADFNQKFNANWLAQHPQEAQRRQIAASAANRSDVNTQNSGNFLTSLKAGITRGMFGIPERLAAAGERYLPSAITGNTSNASYDQILDTIRGNTDADLSKSTPGNLIGQVVGGVATGRAASGALGVVASKAQAVGAPIIAKAGNVLEQLMALKKGQMAANAGKIVTAGAAQGATQAVGQGTDPITGAEEGAAGAAVLGTGFKAAQVLTRPVRDFLRLSNAGTILKRLTSATQEQISALADDYRQKTGAEPTLFELLPLADRNKVLKSAVVGRDATVEQASNAIRARAANLGPEMSARAQAIVAPQRNFIESSMNSDMAAARGAPQEPIAPQQPGQPAPQPQVAGPETVAAATTSPTDMLALRDQEARTIMAPHDQTHVVGDLSDLVPQQHVQGADGQAHAVSTDPEVEAVIRSAAGNIRNRAQGAGISVGDITGIMSKLRNDIGQPGAVGHTAERAVEHLQGVLDEQAPEAGAAARQMQEAYAARSRMAEGMQEGVATRLRDDAQVGTNRGRAQTIRNAYDTPEGAAGRALGQSNRIASDLGGSPEEALAATVDMSRNGTGRQLGQNLGQQPAADLMAAARAQDTSAQALSSAAQKAAGGGAGNVPDAANLSQALLALHPGSFITTKAHALSKLVKMTYIPASRARVMVDMLFSQDPAMTARALAALNKEKGGGEFLKGLAASVGGATVGAKGTMASEQQPGPAAPPIADIPGSDNAGDDSARDPYENFPIVSNPDKSGWDKRADGSEKGMGWLGLRQRPDGKVSSEISVGGEVNGKDMEYPLMVPGLTPEETNYLMTHEPNQDKNPRFIKDMPKSILQKAEAFATQRVAQGLSPFRQAGEQSPIAAVNAAEAPPKDTSAGNITIDPKKPYGRQVIQGLFPEAEITEDVRDPNSKLGKETPNSYHEKSQNAVDVRPIKGMSFGDFIGRIHSQGYTVVEALDEVHHPSRFATGKHWHVVVAE